MARPSSKTPEQRIAEHKQRIERIEANAAKDAIYLNPELNPIQKLLDSLNKEYQTFRNQTKGRNSFEVRLNVLDLRRKKILADEAFNHASMTNADMARKYLTGRINQIVQDKTEITPTLVQEIMSSIPQNDISAFANAAEAANTAYRNAVPSRQEDEEETEEVSVGENVEMVAQNA